MKKIKLSFEITSSNEFAFVCKEGLLKPYSVKYNYVNNFDEKKTLKQIIDSLSKKVSIGQFNYFVLENINYLLWGKYFDESIIFDIEIDEDKILNTPIRDLENQFEISRMPICFHVNPVGMGGNVGNYEGIEFFFHTNEKDIHHQPHIHCKYSEEEFRVDLNDLYIIDKPFKNKSKNKIVLKKIKENQKELLNYWNEVVVNGENIKFRMNF